MGLIDLKTDLKSLRYGKDTIGGGYSGQPYIQTPIPDSFNDLGANEDFILRGGANALGDAATDIRRLTKMFFDLKSPNGVLFIAKQNLLSQTAVRTQTTDVINEGVYTPLNTLAQAGIVELGGHLNKQGINPFIETGAYANSEILYSVKVKPTQLKEENRLARLYQNVQNNSSSKLDGFTLNNGPQNVLTYNGGPNSILGAGKTNIRYSSFRTGEQNPQYVNDPNFFIGKNNQRSVNIDKEQVGGLQINPNKLWTKSPDYLLPNFNVNTPQSSSLSFIPYGPKTWNPQYELPALGYSNNGFVENKEYIYDVIDNSPISQIGGLYDSFFLFNTNWEQYWSVDGKRLQQTSVYKSGSLEPYDPVVKGQKIQKSVNGDNKSNGGLDINTEKIWTKSPKYRLPNFNVNSPQSSSLSKIPYGPDTWNPQWEDADNLPKKYNVTNAAKTLSTYFKKSFPVSNLENLFPDGVFDPTTGQRIKGVENVYITKETPTGKDYLNSPAPPGAGGIGAENASSPYANNTITYNQEDLLTAEPTQYSPAIKEDFRKLLRDKNPNTANYYAGLGQLTKAPDYKKYNVGADEGSQIGNPGERKGKSYASYTTGVSYSGNIKALDKINASPIGTGVNASEGGSNNDLVTFNITPFGGSEVLNFRAFLGSFSDTYSAAINSQQYVGRGENFYTYGGQTRKISLSWTVAALSKQELIPMYKKLSYLASNTAPIYNDGFMQGPLVTLTVGGYVHELPGYIEGLTLEMGEDSTWEIGIDTSGNRDPSVAQLTHIIKVSGFNFTPIPTYLPQKGAHFIDLWNGSATLWGDKETSIT